MLLRGTDTFFLWCKRQELAQEVRLVQQVYADSLQFKAYLDFGEPVNFAVPQNEGPVLSALRLGDRLLVRRSDFSDDQRPVSLKVDGRLVSVPRLEGACQILTVN
jgi:hypothetical protein